MAVRTHDRRQAGHRGPGALIGNVIWVVLFGMLAGASVISSARSAMAVTIIGIPLALANLKLIPVSLMPLGKEIVPVDQARQVAPPYNVVTRA